MTKRKTQKHAEGVPASAPSPRRSAAWPFPEIKDNLAGEVFELMRTEPQKRGWIKHFLAVPPDEQVGWEVRKNKTPYTKACRRLAMILDAAQRDEFVKDSPEVCEFVFMMQTLIESAALGSIDHVDAVLRKALSARASRKTRATGEDTRERVLAVWNAYPSASSVRGRCGDIAEKLNLPESTVRDAVKRLRLDGRIDQQAPKRG